MSKRRRKKIIFSIVTESNFQLYMLIFYDKPLVLLKKVKSRNNKNYQNSLVGRNHYRKCGY